MKRLLILPIVSFIGAAAFCSGMFSAADETAPTPDYAIMDNVPQSSAEQVDEVLQDITTTAPLFTPAISTPAATESTTRPEEVTTDTIRYTTPLRNEGLTVAPEVEVTQPLVTTTTTAVTTTKAPVTTTVPVTTTKAPTTTTKAPTTTNAPVTTKAPTTTKAPATTQAPVVNTPTGGTSSSLSKFLSIAKGEIGVKEKAYNNIKYNTWYYGRAVSDRSDSGSTYAWCAVFVSWCANQAGIPQSVIPKTAGAGTFRNWFNSRGQYFKYSAGTPKPGDLIFIDWDGRHGSIDHVGIVVSVENGIVTTVEGNYSNKVSCNTYSLNSGYIVGYARPNYN